MKRLLKRIEAAMTAAAFAEEGEADTAREILKEAEAAEKGASRGTRPLGDRRRPGAPLAKSRA